MALPLMFVLVMQARFESQSCVEGQAWEYVIGEPGRKCRPGMVDPRKRDRRS